MLMHVVGRRCMLRIESAGNGATGLGSDISKVYLSQTTTVVMARRGT